MGRTPLEIGTSSEHEPIKQYLLTEGAKSGKDLLKDHKSSPSTTPTVTIPSDSKNSLLEEAKLHHFDRNNFGQAKLLLESGALDVNATEEGGLTLLHFAVVHRDLKMVKALVEKGVLTYML